MRAEAVLGGLFASLAPFNPFTTSALCDFLRVTGKSDRKRLHARNTRQSNLVTF
jgi:hypothetical protein